MQCHGHDLFFWQYGADPDNQLMIAQYKARGDSFLPDKPRVWSEKGLVRFGTTRSYDPAPDGKRIVALKPADTPEGPQDHVIFLLNCFDELRRRAPLSTN